MSRAATGAVAAAGCGAMALAAMWPVAVLALLLVLVAGLAAGWPRLLALPSPRGTTAVVGAAGAAAVLAVAWTGLAGGSGATSPTGPGSGPAGPVALGSADRLAPLVVVLGLAVVGAFVHQLLRRDMRPRLVESVAGSVTGVALSVLGTGWLGAALVQGEVVLVGAAGAAAAAAASSLPWPQRLTASLGVAAAVGASALVAGLVPSVPAWQGAFLGAVLGVVVAAFVALLLALPRGGSRRAGLLVAVVAVLACGMPVHQLAQVVGT